MQILKSTTLKPPVPLGETDCYFWIHQERCVKSELAIFGFSTVVAKKYGTRPDLAERFLVTELTSRIVNPAEVLYRVIETMGCGNSVDTMRTLEGHL